MANFEGYSCTPQCYLFEKIAGATALKFADFEAHNRRGDEQGSWVVLHPIFMPENAKVSWFITAWSSVTISEASPPQSATLPQTSSTTSQPSASQLPSDATIEEMKQLLEEQGRLLKKMQARSLDDMYERCKDLQRSIESFKQEQDHFFAECISELQDTVDSESATLWDLEPIELEQMAKRFLQKEPEGTYNVRTLARTCMKEVTGGTRKMLNPKEHKAIRRLVASGRLLEKSDEHGNKFVTICP